MSANNEKETVHLVNSILSRLSIPIPIVDVSDIVPSMWIAIFERVFKVKLPNITRGGSLDTSHTNSTILLENLQSVTRIDLSHLSAENIVIGDKLTSHFLAEIFNSILDIINVTNTNNNNDGGGGGSSSSNTFSKGTDDNIDLSSIENINDSDNEELLSVDLSFGGGGGSSSSRSNQESMEHIISDSREESISGMSGIGEGDRKGKKAVVDDISDYIRKNPYNNKRVSHNTSPSRGQSSKTPKSATKKTRFDLQGDSSSPVPLLKRAPTDTPHITALKLRRAKLIRDFNTKQREIRSNDASFKGKKNETFYDRLKAASGPSGFVDNFNSTKQPTSPKSPLKQSINFNDDYDLYSQSNNNNNNNNNDDLEKPIPLKNFETFQNTIRKTLPNVPIDSYITRKTWDGQVKLWRNALDDRLWNKTVEKQKTMAEKQHAVKSLKVIQKEANDSLRMAQQDKEKSTKRTAVTNLQNRTRAIKRMTKYRQETQKQAENNETRRLLEKEQLLLKSHETFLKDQRDKIVNQRKQQKETRQRVENKLKLDLEAKEHYLKDQIDFIGGKLADAKQQEKVALKAQKEELRKLEREKKVSAIESIQKVHQKLHVDLDNVERLERDLESIRRKSKFVFYTKEQVKRKY